MAVIVVKDATQPDAGRVVSMCADPLDGVVFGENLVKEYRDNLDVPESVEQFGKNSVLYYDARTGQFYYKYEDRPLTMQEMISSVQDMVTSLKEELKAAKDELAILKAKVK